MTKNQAGGGEMGPMFVQGADDPWRPSLAEWVGVTRDGWAKDDSPYVARSRSVTVATDTGGLDSGRLDRLLGNVNTHPFAGAGPGCLLVSGWGRTSTPDGAHADSLTFVLRERPFNQFLTPSGGWATVHDSQDTPPYPEADFEAVFGGRITPAAP